MSPLLSGLVGNIIQLERPETPREPPSFTMDGDQWGGVPTVLQASIPSYVEEKTSTRSASKGEVLENEPPSQVESSEDQPPLEPDGHTQSCHHR